MEKDAMRWSMEQRLHKKRSPEQISRLYYNAGLYYEMEHIICYSSCSTMQKRWNGHISG